jgi:sarcosine oxidase subunit alpha
MHDWHVENGARFVNAGLWKRPHSYPRAGESPEDAANREAKNVRTNVGIVDVSTLGKIELQGKDAVELLNRVYINRWDTLPVGRCRYGVMLRDDGSGAGRRNDVAAWRDALPDDDDYRQCRHGDATSRAPVAG